MKKTFCDRCNHEIDSEEMEDSESFMMGNHDKHYDLCDNCTRCVIEVIEGYHGGVDWSNEGRERLG